MEAPGNRLWVKSPRGHSGEGSMVDSFGFELTLNFECMSLTSNDGMTIEIRRNHDDQ